MDFAVASKNEVITEVFQIGPSNRRMPNLKNRDPCGTSCFDFCKVAIGGLIATLQNFSDNTK
jgi:hypothetical protein